MGFEPMTFSLATRRSTTELHPPFLYVVHKVGHTGEESELTYKDLQSSA